MTGEQVFARLARSRQALHQAIQGLSEQDLTQVQVEGVWTIRDILGHIASWDETCLTPLQHYVDGGPFDAVVMPDHLAWNDEQAARKQTLPLDAILDQWTAIRQDLLAAARRLSEEQWMTSVPCPWGGSGAIAELLEGLAYHEQAHARTVKRWRKGSRP